MKNLSQILEEKEKEFEANFITNKPPAPPYIEDEFDVPGIKVFLSSSLRSAVEEALKECRPEEKKTCDHKSFRYECPRCHQADEANCKLFEYDIKVKEFLK